MSQTGSLQPRRLWVAAGALAVTAAVLADFLGVGGSPGIGLRELILIVPGAALVASQMWRGSTAGTTRSCVTLWIWVGLVGGLVEAGQWALIAYRTGEITRQSAHYPWMIPVTYLVVFTALGILSAVAVRLAPKLLCLPVIVIVPALIAGWSTICNFDWMDDLAGLALAGGIALTLGRAAAANPEGFLRTVRRTTIAMLGLVVALAAWVVFSLASAERTALAELPSARDGAPNVILIVLDTARADRFAAYGADREVMPEIDAFGESSVIFDWAVATAPWTLPSHASLFTGTFPHQQTVGWVKPLDDTHATLAEVLGQHGYVTAGFVANLGYCAPDSGLSRGFAHYEDYYVTPSTMIGATKTCRELMNKRRLPPHFALLRNSAGEITDRFLSWSEQQDRPFFAFLNYYDPHAMYVAPPPFDSKFGKPSPVLYDFHKRNSRWSDWTAAEAQTIIDGYDGCMAYMDNEIGRLLDQLEARGALDQTLVIITSDHGELFGELDLQEHQNCLHLALVRVPLFVRFPAAATPSGHRVSEAVSLADLPATILDLIGIDPATPLPGHSLAPLWSGNAAAPRSFALSEVNKPIRKPDHWPAMKGDMNSLFLGGLHYVINRGDGSEELYDVAVDPEELDNLIGSRPEDAERMRAALKSALAK